MRIGPPPALAVLFALLASAPASLAADEGVVDTRIFSAVREKDAERVRVLVREGVNLEAFDIATGHTPLALASSLGEEDLVEVLLGAGADPDNKINIGDTALKLAARAGHTAVVRLLLEKGADPKGVGPTGTDALFYACGGGWKEEGDAFFGRVGQAARVATATLLLEAGADPNLACQGGETPDCQGGETALMGAARLGNPELVRLLLSKGASPRAEENSQQSTPLSFAVTGEGRKDPWSEAARIRSAGADDRVECVRAILETNIDPEKGGWLEGSPLHLAVRGGDPVMVETLLEWGARAHGKDAEGVPPLVRAVQLGKLKALTALLEGKAELDITDPKGNTALHHAAAGGKLEALDILLARKGDPSPRNKNGATPLLLAAGVPGGVEGRHPRLGLARDSTGRWYEAVPPALRREAMKRLLAAGAEAVEATPSGETALHGAARIGDQEMIRLLMGKGAKAGAAGGVDKSTPLHLAAREDRWEAARELSLAGASPEAKDGWGNTPLDLAQAYASPEMVSLLEGKGKGAAPPPEREPDPELERMEEEIWALPPAQKLAYARSASPTAWTGQRLGEKLARMRSPETRKALLTAAAGMTSESRCAGLAGLMLLPDEEEKREAFKRGMSEAGSWAFTVAAMGEIGRPWPIKLLWEELEVGRTLPAWDEELVLASLSRLAGKEFPSMPAFRDWWEKEGKRR